MVYIAHGSCGSRVRKPTVPLDTQTAALVQSTPLLTLISRLCAPWGDGLGIDPPLGDTAN
jgi:hypothetical protein